MFIDWCFIFLVGIFSWDFWQYLSRIKIFGEYYVYDWDVFDGSLIDLKVKCGLEELLLLVLIWVESVDVWVRFCFVDFYIGLYFGFGMNLDYGDEIFV